MMEKDEKEIDLLGLARKLWDNKRFIIKVSVIGGIIGLIISFSIPRVYTSSVVFITDSSENSMGNVGALASLAGINLNAQPSDIISSELYPNIVASTSYIRGLLDVTVVDNNQKIDTTLYSYLKNEQKFAWWSYIFKAPGLFLSLFITDNQEETINSQYFISEEEMKVIETLKDSYSISTDKKTGITRFDLTSQSPVISAFLADTITSYLQSYIIEERTKKATTDLNNAIKLYDQSKESYHAAQQKLATFLDRNKNISSAIYAINQKKIEDETSLAYSVYTQMAQQLQLYKIKVQDDTPVFTIIQPAVEPIYPSNIPRIIILVLFLFLSFALATIILLKDELLTIFNSKL